MHSFVSSAFGVSVTGRELATRGTTHARRWCDAAVLLVVLVTGTTPVDVCPRYRAMPRSAESARLPGPGPSLGTPRYGGVMPHDTRSAQPGNDRLVSDRITIDATPDVVFAIVADPRQHARIDGSGSVRGLVTGPDRLAEGETFGVSMRLFGLPYKISNRVVEFEEDRRIAWRHFGAHRWRYELDPTEDGRTVVTETFDFTRHNRLSAAALRLAGFPERNRAGIAETLVRLKQAAEHDEKATP